MAKNVVVIGTQWGDEGKGKIVDVLTSKYDIIARFQGGPNAGHTLEFDGIKHVLHTIPSGIFHKGVVNLIGNGVVIDPVIFQKEIFGLEKLKLTISELLISKKAHLILPTHKLIDAASEQAKGKEKIGSTLKGIGPTYMDKTGRNGIRVGDVSSPKFKEKYEKLNNEWVRMNKSLERYQEFTHSHLVELVDKSEKEAVFKSSKFQQTVSEIAVFMNEFFEENGDEIAEVVEFYFFIHNKEIDKVIEDQELPVITRKYALELKKYMIFH